jgi:branched-chain amino acid transport system permease protein
MVFACSLMFPDFFGGEAGITVNRVIGEPFLGITYGPAIQVYYLIMAWALVCMAAMFAWTQTPLGRMANAVRDNPERTEFVGYDTHMVRFLTLVLSAFFAGVAGALNCINYEIVTAENVGAVRSGGVLLATFIGGALFYFGPILGAIIFTFFAVALSDFTKAWQLYLGTFFVVMVMYAPGGIASVILMNLRVAKYGLYSRLRDPLAGVLLAGAALLVGVIMMIELSYFMTLEAANGTVTSLFGFKVDAASSEVWVIAVGMLVGGAAAFEAMRRNFVREWDLVQESIEDMVAREVRV